MNVVVISSGASHELKAHYGYKSEGLAEERREREMLRWDAGQSISYSCNASLGVKKSRLVVYSKI